MNHRTPIERRSLRSEDPGRALHYQLDRCREDGCLEAMFIADDNGLCLASAGELVVCEELAAATPLLARKVGDFDGVLLSANGGFRLLMQRFRLAGSELYACAVGEGVDYAARFLGRTIHGAGRILAV